MSFSLTLSQVTNYSGFPKAAELIEINGAHDLEASDRAIFNHILQLVHDSGRLTEPDAEWEIPLLIFRRAASKHESYDRIRQSLRRLRRTEVVVRYVDARTNRRRELETNLLDYTDTDVEDSDTSTFKFGIPKPLRNVLARSNRWGRIRCEVAYAMSSKYAIALYEKLCLWINLEQSVRTMSIQDFRELLGVPPKTYDRGADFERKVIGPAVFEVNGLSDLGVKIEVHRRYSRAPIHGVTIAWWKKDADAFRAALEERRQPKLGRSARLRDKAEPVAVGFTGSLGL